MDLLGTRRVALVRQSPRSQEESLPPQSRSVTCRRSPEVSSTAFDAQPPDLPPVRLMNMGFVVVCRFARPRRPHIRFLFIGSHLCSALLSGPASRRVLFSPLRFAMTSPSSGCQRDFHPQAVERARHTNKRDGLRRPWVETPRY